MGNDSTTSAIVGRAMTDQEHEHFTKCLEQLFGQALRTQSQILLVTHQELNDLRKSLVGEED